MTEDDIKTLLSGHARIEQRIDDIHGRLFGNGQPGIIQHLYTQSAGLDEKLNAINLKLATADAEHAGVAKTEAKFWGGVCSAGSFLGGICADWLLFGRK